MKCLILAAGRGTRISRYLSGNPKCTVKIGDKMLIQHTIDLLRAKGINEIAVALGYKSEVIIQALKGRNIQYFYNPFYDITNSIASVWFAKDFLKGDDMIFMNGDVYIEEDILIQILEEKKNPVLFSDQTRKEEADYKLYYENNILLKYGKDLSGNDITGEYIGIAKVEKSFLFEFNQQLDYLISKQKHSLWWENVLYELSNKTNVYVEDIKSNFWAEVDYIEDYERIMNRRMLNSIKEN